MIVGCNRQLQAVDACTVMVMVFTTVCGAIFMIRSILISREMRMIVIRYVMLIMKINVRML